MKRFHNLLVICSAAYGLLAASGAASASSYIVTMEQVGSDVIAAGSGQLDLTNLTFLRLSASPERE